MRAIIVLVSLLFLISGRAHGLTTVLCVSSTPGPGGLSLNDALSLARVQAASGIGSEIRLKQGTYGTMDIVGTGNAQYTDLKLLGGYSPDDNCDPANRVVSASNTSVSVLPGINNAIIGSIFELEGLSLSSSSSSSLKIASECDVNVNANIDIAENEFSKVAIYINVCEATFTAKIRNNLIAYAAEATYGAISLDATNGVMSTTIENNTIASSIGCGILLDTYKSNVEVSLFNNVIWGNASGGICDEGQSEPSPIALVNNTLQSNNTIIALSNDYATSYADPKFVNPATGDYHLQPTSPAVNSGSPSQPDDIGPSDTDLDGNPRIVGPLIDRGAYESPEAPLPIVVNSTGDYYVNPNNPDPNEMTLRNAIYHASLIPGSQTIQFDISGQNTIIQLNSPLPDITKSLTIDGYSQSNTKSATYNQALVGFNANLPIVLTGAASRALHVPDNPAYKDVTLTVSGIKFAGGFSSSAISLEGGHGHFIWGNEFSTGALRSSTDIFVAGSASGVKVGGDEVRMRNLLSGASSYAVSLTTSGNAVVKNLIGPGRSGQADPYAANNTGVYIALGAKNNVVRGNTISGNDGFGIVLSGAGSNTIQDNLIGTAEVAYCAPPCTPALGNGKGILVAAGSSGNHFRGNVLAYNATGLAAANNSGGNAFELNRFYGNTGLAIDLSNNGTVNANNADPTEPTSAANAGQNYPLLHGIVPGADAQHATVNGQLHSRPGTFTITLFANDSCDASGYGEGDEKIGTQTGVATSLATMTDNGTATFAIPVTSAKALDGRYITALATDQNHNTSEFSKCMPADRIFADGGEI